MHLYHIDLTCFRSPKLVKRSHSDYNCVAVRLRSIPPINTIQILV
jgi:hypothetical protein